jgi:hypothetical protein
VDDPAVPVVATADGVTVALPDAGSAAGLAVPAPRADGADRTCLASSGSVRDDAPREHPVPAARTER